MSKHGRTDEERRGGQTRGERVRGQWGGRRQEDWEDRIAKGVAGQFKEWREDGCGRE